jgi:hypothetical protein
LRRRPEANDGLTSKNPVGAGSRFQFIYSTADTFFPGQVLHLDPTDGAGLVDQIYMKNTTNARRTIQKATIFIYWFAFLVPWGSERQGPLVVWQEVDAQVSDTEFARVGQVFEAPL